MTVCSEKGQPVTQVSISARKGCISLQRSSSSTVREEGLDSGQWSIPAKGDPMRQLGNSGSFKLKRSTKEEFYKTPKCAARSRANWANSRETAGHVQKTQGKQLLLKLKQSLV